MTSDRQEVGCILHCGDFGFYDQSSYDEIPTSELRRRIERANISKKLRSKLLATSISEFELRNVARQNRILGDFEDYLNGVRHFAKPVFAIWGNHDDADVVRKVIAHPIKNLFVITPMDAYDAGDFVVIGCGGKIFLDGYFTVPYFGYERIAITGDRFSPRPSILDFITLLNTARKTTQGKPIVTLFHHGADDDPLTTRFIDLMTWDVRAGFALTSTRGNQADVSATDTVARREIPLSGNDALIGTFNALCERFPSCRQYIEEFRPVGCHIDGSRA